MPDSVICGLRMVNIPQDSLAVLSVTEGSYDILESLKDLALFRKCYMEGQTL